MEQYVIVSQKPFESKGKFQKRINDQAKKGYKAVGISGQMGGHVLMEKVY